MKQLVINADDFGFTQDVNQGIVDAHRDGILTAATLMANGGQFGHAVRLANETPTLDIGCHLVLTGGQSLLPHRKQLPASVASLTCAVMANRIPIEDELRAQVEKILSAGITPTHLDTHKHTHLLPQVLNAVVRLSEEYKIRWVRRPFDFPYEGTGIPWHKRTLSRSLTLVRRHFHRHLTLHGCLTTDHFAGFSLTGRFRKEQLLTILRTLPEGSTELMCHPGRHTRELEQSNTRLKQSRQRELEALIDPHIRTELDQLGIKLVTYRSLGNNESSTEI